jgi:hypothetical protein
MAVSLRTFKKKGRTMKALIFSVVCFLIVLAPSLLDAGEISKETRVQAATLYGEQAKLLKSEISVIYAYEVPDRVKRFCKSYQFYRVGIPVPDEGRSSMTSGVLYYKMAAAEQALPLNTSHEIAAFLSGIKAPLATENALLLRVGVFVDLLGGEIATNMPTRESLFEQYKNLKPEDWKQVIKETDTGWQIYVPVLVEKFIEHYTGYTLALSREGKMTLIEQKDLYYYTMCE